MMKYVLLYAAGAALSMALFLYHYGKYAELRRRVSELQAAGMPIQALAAGLALFWPLWIVTQVICGVPGGWRNKGEGQR